jgi:hypothetical protein
MLTRLPVLAFSRCMQISADVACVISNRRLLMSMSCHSFKGGLGTAKMCPLRNGTNVSRERQVCAPTGRATQVYLFTRNTAQISSSMTVMMGRSTGRRPVSQLTKHNLGNLRLATKDAHFLHMQTPPAVTPSGAKQYSTPLIAVLVKAGREKDGVLGPPTANRSKGNAANAHTGAISRRP